MVGTHSNVTSGLSYALRQTRVPQESTVKFLFYSHLSVASAPNPALSEHMSLVHFEVTAFPILGTMSKTNASECHSLMLPKLSNSQQTRGIFYKGRLTGPR